MKNSLSKGLYRYIGEMLTNQQGEEVRVKSWGQVARLLQQAGYSLYSSWTTAEKPPQRSLLEKIKTEEETVLSLQPVVMKYVKGYCFQQ